MSDELREANSLLSWRKNYITSTSVFLLPRTCRLHNVSMEGDEVLHNELHSSARSLDPNNEVSTLTDTIDVLITTGNIHAQVASYLS